MASHANPVNWFEISVGDLARAKKFYEAILGVVITESEMGPSKMGFFPMELGAMGSAGTLVEGEGYTPSMDGTLVYLYVDSIDPTLKLIDDAGGKTLMPRTSIGEHGFIAHFQDTEGNRVALHETL
jgi:predicted enzyme related to lactoylglutathione lyase